MTMWSCIVKLMVPAASKQTWLPRFASSTSTRPTARSSSPVSPTPPRTSPSARLAPTRRTCPSTISSASRASAELHSFRSKRTQPGKGGLFERMFHYFNYRRDEFLQHYHKRSNVESTFSMVKAKFGHAVRSKSDTAMVNEVLCKFLVHNLCVLNQEQCELRIETEFWQADEPGMLALAGKV